MTELSFLIDLLLNHKLTKSTKDSIQARIMELEQISNSREQNPINPIRRNDISKVNPEPVQQIAQTPEAIAALELRKQAMTNSHNSIFKVRPK